MSNSFDITKANISIKRLTESNEWREATQSTVGGKSLGSNTSWIRMLAAEHSPIRGQWYRVTMDIPYFASVHFARHKVGVEHYVQSMRDDRGGTGNENRMTIVRHTMDINAQAMMTISHARLCKQSHSITRNIMGAIVEELGEVDKDLASMCMPKCEYRGGCCFELKYCGKAGISHVNTKDFDRYSLSDKPCTGGACSI